MKRFPILINVFLFAVFCIPNLSASNNNFSFKPDKPQVGKQITIRYDAKGTQLESASSVKIIVHEYSNVLDRTEEYELKKDGDSWSGNFSTSDTAKGVLIRFKDGEVFDDNDKKLYLINLYDKEGKLLAGSVGGAASAYSSWIQFFDIDPDYATAYKLFQQEFEAHPEKKKDFIGYYLRTVRNVLKENTDEVIMKEIDQLAAANSGSEDDYMLIINLYRGNRIVDKSFQLENEYKQKFPSGKYIPTFKMNEYRMNKESAKKIEFLQNFEAAYPGNQFIDYMYNDIITLLAKEGKTKEAVEFLGKYKNAASNVYNSLAWNLYEKDMELNLADSLAKVGVDIANEELKNPKGKRSPLATAEEWKEQREEMLSILLDTYGAILIKQNKAGEAEKILEEAVTLGKREEAETNERYAALLITLGKYSSAQKELEQYTSSGFATASMKEMLKEAFVKNNGSEEKFDSYYAKFEEAGKRHLMNELKKQLINEPAPQFSLFDLEGRQVSLADFKGQTVVVDFWATWCGPCITSFPGMKKAVEKLEQTGKAKFLFVNAWENVENKKQNAEDFIKKNNYQFHVLLDEKNEVITSFKVSGIPTKFIIDKNGNIRFKSVGFSGSTEALAEEIGLMIEMIQ
ncbi:MAG: redoxin domain-containing protein [Ignavibacteriales bacterium]|nr:redoxin domain-containing protein [Ignavibacteriales bacterium]